MRWGKENKGGSRWVVSFFIDGKNGGVLMDAIDIMYDKLQACREENKRLKARVKVIKLLIAEKKKNEIYLQQCIDGHNQTIASLKRQLGG